MLNKAMHKTRCKCMRKRKEKERSIHGDDTNVLTKEFKLFAIKRFGEQISLLIINVNELKSQSTIFDKLPNEVMLNLYVFSSRMLNRILRDVYGTGIVTIDSKIFLTNTIIKEFLHLQKLGATTTGSQCYEYRFGPRFCPMEWNISVPINFGVPFQGVSGYLKNNLYIFLQNIKLSILINK